jgi:hypothetical protein
MTVDGFFSSATRYFYFSLPSPFYLLFLIFIRATRLTAMQNKTANAPIDALPQKGLYRQVDLVGPTLARVYRSIRG